MALSSWNDKNYTYTICAINLGSNPIGSLEIVSSLNSFNLARYQYHFNYPYCTQKYNPKVYFGTIQTTSTEWLYDNDPARKNLAQGSEKSGSWHIKNLDIATQVIEII